LLFILAWIFNICGVSGGVAFIGLAYDQQSVYIAKRGHVDRVWTGLVRRGTRLRIGRRGQAILEKLKLYGPMKFATLVRMLGDYSRLKKTVSNSLRRLMDVGCVARSPEGVYSITSQGESYLMRPKTGSVPKYFVMDLVKREKLDKLRDEVCEKVHDKGLLEVLLKLTKILEEYL